MSDLFSACLNLFHWILTFYLSIKVHRDAKKLTSLLERQQELLEGHSKAIKTLTDGRDQLMRHANALVEPDGVLPKNHANVSALCDCVATLATGFGLSQEKMLAQLDGKVWDGEAQLELVSKMIKGFAWKTVEASQESADKEKEVSEPRPEAMERIAALKRGVDELARMSAKKKDV